jgi:peptide/nickel transport system substrate-binding protein
VVAVRTEPQSFNWFTRHDASTHLVTLLTQARLVRINGTTQDVEPWLAESWTRSADGLRYTIRLRSDARFSDGTSLTAEDVVFSIDAAYDAGSVLSDSMKVGGKRLAATASPDGRVVTIDFPSAFGPGLRLLDNLPVLPMQRLKAARDAGAFASAWGLATPVEEVTGLGPFAIDDYRPGERLVFVRNAHYFGRDAQGAPLPYMDRIVVEIVPDQDAQVLRLGRGEIDTTAAEVRPEDYAPLKRAEDEGRLRLLDLGVALDPDSLWVNLRPRAFDKDPRRSWIQRDELRQAISMAVDRRRFVDLVYLGAAVPVSGPVTTANRKWSIPDLPETPHDLPRARALLAEIGLVDRDGDGLVEDLQGTPARLTLLTQRGHTALERGAAVIRDQVRHAGLTIDVVSLEGNALVQRFLSGAEYDAVYFHLGTTDTDPALNLDFWLSSGGAHVWNPGQSRPSTEWEQRIDDLMLRQAAALDEGERRHLFAEVQKLFAAHLPMVHFAAPRILVAASAGLTNLSPSVSRPQLLWSAETLKWTGPPR